MQRSFRWASIFVLLLTLISILPSHWHGGAQPAVAAAAPVAAALPAADFPSSAAPAPAAQQTARYFNETQYGLANDAVWGYFSHRGSIRTFGYPVSRLFVLDGFPVQMFQRGILQMAPDGGVRPLNMLDPELMPYTQVNFSQFPAADDALKAKTPQATDPNYSTKIVQFVRDNAPDTWNGLPVNFSKAFFGTVTCQDAYPEGNCPENLLPLLNLELWGAPISAPQYDPNNQNFVYQRFQRGIMHFDAQKGVTQGVLLADYFKSILTNENLPPDLGQAAQGSKYYAQYEPSAQFAVARPAELPNSNLTNAFEPMSQSDMASASQPSGMTAPSGATASAVGEPTPVSTTAPAVTQPSGPDDRFGVVVTGLPSGQFTPDTVASVVHGLGATWWYAYGARPMAAPNTHRVELVFTGEKWKGVDPDDIAARVAVNPGAAWMIGNEPNTPGQDNVTPEQYADQFQEVVTAIKAADPSAVIVGPNTLNWDIECYGTCGGLVAGHTWTQAFLDSYAAKYGGVPPIDIWGVHAYEVNWKRLPMVDTAGPQSDLEAFRQFVDAQPGQQGKPIWLTEFGIIWGYEAYEVETVNDKTVVIPVGAFRSDLITAYVRNMSTWLTTRGAEIGITRWFLYASYSPPEPYTPASGTVSLYNGPVPDSGLSDAGQVYQSFASGGG